MAIVIGHIEPCHVDMIIAMESVLKTKILVCIYGSSDTCNNDIVVCFHHCMVYTDV